MGNRTRFAGEPETLFEKFGANWAADVVRDRPMVAEPAAKLE